MSNGPAASLPWKALQHTEGDIPWDALNQFADALAADPPLWERIREVYDDFMERPYEVVGYECYYVPAVFALAAPRLDEAARAAIGRFLVDEMVVAADQDDDYLIEVLEAAAGSMGPAVLPAVLDALARRKRYHPAWFHLWSLTELAAGCRDEALRERVVRQCRQALEDAARGRYASIEACAPAWTLAKMGRQDALPLVRRVQERDRCPDLEEAIDMLESGPEPDPVAELWEEPVRTWLEPRWKALREWYEKGGEDEEEDEGEEEGYGSELVERFAESAAVARLPDDLHDHAGFITDTLLRYARDYADAGPEELTEDVLREVLLDVFPRKVSAEPEVFQCLVPVAQAFLRWLGSEGILRNAERLAQAIGPWQARIVSKAADPANWGMAKGFVMQARSDGVNVEDPAELRRYMAVYNERIAGRRLADGPEDEEDADDDLTPELPWPETIHVPQEVGRNDPCPCGSGKKFKKCCGRKGTVQ